MQLSSRPFDGHLKRKRLSYFLIWTSLLWVVFVGIHVALPGIRPGVTQVVEAKVEQLDRGVELEEADYPVVIVGNSRVLAGVNPQTWSTVSAGRSSILNLGIPGDASAQYVSYLERLLENGGRPSHVLLTSPWGATEKSGLATGLSDDDGIMDSLFPFRELPRNAALFLVESRRRGGPREFYRSGLRTTEQVVADGGYYFIEEQSHFTGDQLPLDFTVDTDSPNEVRPTNFDFESEQLTALLQLSQEYSFELLYVPVPHRVGEYAEPPSDLAASDELASNSISAVGPGYILLEPAYFSDPVHLNRSGAVVYTEAVWAMVEPFLN